MIVYYDGFGHEVTTAMRIMESGQKSEETGTGMCWWKWRYKSSIDC